MLPKGIRINGSADLTGSVKEMFSKKLPSKENKEAYGKPVLLRKPVNDYRDMLEVSSDRRDKGSFNK